MYTRLNRFQLQWNASLTLIFEGFFSTTPLLWPIPTTMECKSYLNFPRFFFQLHPPPPDLGQFIVMMYVYFFTHFETTLFSIITYFIWQEKSKYAVAFFSTLCNSTQCSTPIPPTLIEISTEFHLQLNSI